MHLSTTVAGETWITIAQPICPLSPRPFVIQDYEECARDKGTMPINVSSTFSGLPVKELPVNFEMSVQLRFGSYLSDSYISTVRHWQTHSACKISSSVNVTLITLSTRHSASFFVHYLLILSSWINVHCYLSQCSQPVFCMNSRNGGSSFYKLLG